MPSEFANVVLRSPEIMVEYVLVATARRKQWRVPRKSTYSHAMAFHGSHSFTPCCIPYLNKITYKMIIRIYRHPWNIKLSHQYQTPIGLLFFTNRNMNKTRPIYSSNTSINMIFTVIQVIYRTLSFISSIGSMCTARLWHIIMISF